MTAFRAVFDVEHFDGRAMDEEYVRTALEEACEDIAELYVQDDDDHEGIYGVKVDRVEVVT